MARRLFVAFVALSACLIGGCSDGESNDPKPSSGTADAPQAVDGDQDSSMGDKSAAPTLPDGAQEDTLEGAKAFIRHYVDLLNYAANTGNVTSLRAAARGCDGCRKYEELYESTYQNGGYMREPGWHASDMFAAVQGDGSTGVLVTIQAPRMRYRLNRNTEEKIGRRDVYKLRFEVARRSDEWVVTFFGLQTEADDL
ncbi:MAG: DUF6318 family protein [Nocardioidaceae bacterium]